MAFRHEIITDEAARPAPRRSRGRRASDRGPTLEALLVATAIIAWGWGAYEIAQLFVP
jgi:hypothetical protein